MLPEIKIGSLRIDTYLVLLSLGLAVLAVRLTLEKSIPWKPRVSALVTGITVGVVLLASRPSFLSIADIGILGFFAWCLARRMRPSYWQEAIIENLAPWTAFAVGLARLGCFAAGCCFDRPWEHGIAFPEGSAAWFELSRSGLIEGTSTVPLFPTQVLLAAGMGILGVVLFFLKGGIKAAVLFLGWGGLRMLLEPMRWYESNELLAAGVPWNALRDAVLVGIGIWLLMQRPASFQRERRLTWRARPTGRR